MANRYFIAGGVDSNWGSILNWSTTSGGVGGSAVPLATDDVFFDGSSPDCTVNASNRVALTFTTTGYTNTITMNFNISVSGAITLGSGSVFAAGSGGKLLGIITASHTFNGVVVPNLGFSGVAQTHTLVDNASCTNFFPANTNQSFTINGSQVNVSGNLDLSLSTTGVTSGSTIVNLTGTGALVLMTSTGVFRLPIVFNNGANTFTIPTGTFRYNTGSITYTSGTVSVNSGSVLDTSSTATTLSTTSSVAWGSVTLAGGGITYTLGADFYYDGTMTLGTTTGTTTLNGNKIYTKGTFRNNVTTGVITGTTKIYVNDTVTFDAPSLTTGRMTNSIVMTGGALTVSAAFTMNLNGFQRTGGSLTTGEGSSTFGGTAGNVGVGFAG